MVITTDNMFVAQNNCDNTNHGKRSITTELNVVVTQLNMVVTHGYHDSQNICGK
jgi:hypothetical protein